MLKFLRSPLTLLAYWSLEAAFPTYLPYRQHAPAKRTKKGDEKYEFPSPLGYFEFSRYKATCLSDKQHYSQCYLMAKRQHESKRQRLMRSAQSSKLSTPERTALSAEPLRSGQSPCAMRCAQHHVLHLRCCSTSNAYGIGWPELLGGSDSAPPLKQSQCLVTTNLRPA